MKKRLNKYQDKQGSFAKMALLAILLFLLFWRDKVKEWFCEPCACENKPDQEKEIPFFSPDFNPEMQSQDKEISKELFERENDKNVLDLSKHQITQTFFPETDTLKLSMFK